MLSETELKILRETRAALLAAGLSPRTLYAFDLAQEARTLIFEGPGLYSLPVDALLSLAEGELEEAHDFVRDLYADAETMLDEKVAIRGLQTVPDDLES